MVGRRTPQSREPLNRTGNRGVPWPMAYGDGGILGWIGAGRDRARRAADCATGRTLAGSARVRGYALPVSDAKAPLFRYLHALPTAAGNSAQLPVGRNPGRTEIRWSAKLHANY